MGSNPNRSGASMFPAAARANRNVFYSANGQPRTLADIYSRFSDRLDQGAQSAGATGSASGMPESFDAAQVQWAQAGQALEGGGEVVLGNGATDGDRQWINTTLANLNTLREPMNPMRPTPQNARLAYLMLASLGA
jgi:hypothetical protein